MKKSLLKYSPQRSTREKGQSMVELAVSLVVLLIIVGGLVDVGRMIFVYISLRDAAEEGAIYGSIEPYDTENYTKNCSEIENHVMDILTSQNILSESDDIDVTVKINNKLCESDEMTIATDACTGKPIYVSVERNNFPFTMPFFSGDTINLEAHIENTIIRPQCQ